MKIDEHLLATQQQQPGNKLLNSESQRVTQSAYLYEERDIDALGSLAKFR